MPRFDPIVKLKFKTISCIFLSRDEHLVDKMADNIPISRQQLLLLVNTASELASLMDDTRAANVKGYTKKDRDNFSNALTTYRDKRSEFYSIINQRELMTIMTTELYRSSSYHWRSFILLIHNLCSKK